MSQTRSQPHIKGERGLLRWRHPVMARRLVYD
jgi:hypothetical protein